MKKTIACILTAAAMAGAALCADDLPLPVADTLSAPPAPPSAVYTLDWCQQAARDNYPLTAQAALVDAARDYTVQVAMAGWLPKVTLSVKTTYQSDVSVLPIKLPGMSIPSPSKDQYQVLAEVNQTIWDGGAIASQKNIAGASADADRQKNEVDLYALTDRVNQLFLGIILLDGQLEQNRLLLDELDTNYKRVAAYIANGVANRSDLDAVRVEQLNAGQKRVELTSSREAFREMLGRMTGARFDDESVFEAPVINAAAVPEGSALPAEAGTSVVSPSGSADASGSRPEFALFEAQTRLLEAQKKALYAQNRPKFGAFVQAGYGKPSLNMFDTDPASFYIAGLRLSWPLDGFYSLKSNLGRIDVSERTVALQKKLFEYNLDLKFVQQRNEIEKIRELIRSDDEIIALRSSIKKAAGIKVENGTMSVNDLLGAINAENLAKQARSLHEIQLLLSVYNLKNTVNN